VRKEKTGKGRERLKRRRKTKERTRVQRDFEMKKLAY
jgi:hypothetical protein